MSSGSGFKKSKNSAFKPVVRSRPKILSKPGMLRSYGYSVFYGTRTRHKSLTLAVEYEKKRFRGNRRKACEMIGERLMCISNFHARRPELVKTFRADAKWVKKYGPCPIIREGPVIITGDDGPYIESCE